MTRGTARTASDADRRVCTHRSAAEPRPSADDRRRGPLAQSSSESFGLGVGGREKTALQPGLSCALCCCEAGRDGVLVRDISAAEPVNIGRAGQLVVGTAAILGQSGRRQGQGEDERQVSYSLHRFEAFLLLSVVNAGPDQWILRRIVTQAHPPHAGSATSHPFRMRNRISVPSRERLDQAVSRLAQEIGDVDRRQRVRADDRHDVARAPAGRGSGVSEDGQGAFQPPAGRSSRGGVTALSRMREQCGPRLPNVQSQRASTTGVHSPAEGAGQARKPFL